MTPTHPLRHAAFVWYWLAQSVSLLGDRVYGVALPFLVLELGGGAGEIGRVLAVYSVPQLLFLLLGGVLVDRVSRRLTLLGSNVAHALLLLVALTLLVSGRLELTHLYVFAGLFGLLSAFFMPATLSIVPQLVPRDLLPRANALRALAAELTGIIGPPLGGVLIATGGLSLALAFDTLAFGVGALCLLALSPLTVQPETDTKPASYWHDLKEGFVYVAGSSWLWVTIVLFSFVKIFAGGSAGSATSSTLRNPFRGRNFPRLAAREHGWRCTARCARPQPRAPSAAGLDGLSRCGRGGA